MGSGSHRGAWRRGRGSLRPTRTASGTVRRPRAFCDTVSTRSDTADRRGHWVASSWTRSAVCLIAPELVDARIDLRCYVGLMSIRFERRGALHVKPGAEAHALSPLDSARRPAERRQTGARWNGPRVAKEWPAPSGRAAHSGLPQGQRADLRGVLPPLPVLRDAGTGGRAQPRACVPRDRRGLREGIRPADDAVRPHELLARLQRRR